MEYKESNIQCGAMFGLAIIKPQSPQNEKVCPKTTYTKRHINPIILYTKHPFIIIY
jgi:hypothetical protein